MSLLLLLSRGGGPPPTPVTYTTRRLATYELAVSWEDYYRGIFTIGFSTLGGTDIISGSSQSEGFDGPYDVVPRVEHVSIRRGRSDDLSAMQAGTISWRSRDFDGRYDSRNPSSPLAGKLRPLRPVRFRVTYNGQVFDRYRGYTRRYSWDAAGRGGYADQDALDLFQRLGGNKVGSRPVISTTATTTGGAIGLILDAMQITADSRSLGTGDAITFSADGSKTALQLIEELLIAERGVFYISRAGIATYRDRYSRYPSSPAGSVTSTMTALGSGSSADDVLNKQRVTRTGGVEQVATDTTSAALYDEREGTAIESPYLLSDAAASALAGFIVSRGKDPAVRLWSVDLENRDHDTFLQMLYRDIGDRVTITEARTGTTQDYIIEGVDEAVDFRTGAHRVRWLVSRAAILTPFVIGQSLIGGTDQFVY